MHALTQEVVIKLQSSYGSEARVWLCCARLVKWVARVPVDGERLARLLLLGHADDAGRAAVGAAQARAAHAVAAPAHAAHALAHLRMVHHVPAVHRQDPPEEPNTHTATHNTHTRHTDVHTRFL